MSFMWRALRVVVGIVVGAIAVDYFLIGNTADYQFRNSRIGYWREAKVRPACYPATEYPEKDTLGPQRPPGQNRLDWADVGRTQTLTAALNCYLVSQRNAVCEPNNRAYIVDYTRKYFDKFNEMKSAAASSYDKGEVETVGLLWNSARNQAITTALTDHIRNGRLRRVDFGWSVPAELAGLFKQYPNAGDACAKETAWIAVKL